MLISWNHSKYQPVGFHAPTFLSAPDRISRRTYRGLIKKTGSATDPLYQVEVRANLEGEASLLLVVALDGWNMKHEQREPDRWGRSTRGKHVRLSLNSAAWLSMDEFVELEWVAQEAYEYLEAFVNYVSYNPGSLS